MTKMEDKPEQNYNFYKLHQILIYNDNVDSDNWYNGGHEDIYRLLNCFSQDDFNYLFNNLACWKSSEMNIFADALLWEYGNSQITNSTIDCRKLISKIITLIDVEYLLDLDAWEIILSLDFLNLLGLKKRMFAYQKVHPSVYKDGKIWRGYDYNRMFKELDQAIAAIAYELKEVNISIFPSDKTSKDWLTWYDENKDKLYWDENSNELTIRK
jgi:hypothetical protein